MRIAALAMTCLLAAGCQDENIRTGVIGGGFAAQDAAATFTTADIRAIVRRRLHGRTIVCTEPLPDVARAFAQSGQLSASGGNGVATGSLAASAASAQAIAELAGRSTALLGIRDGLYRACEAYANGIIGDDAYALVMSRYGQLMVTLFLAQDMAAAEAGASAETKAATASIGAGSPPSPAASSAHEPKQPVSAASGRLAGFEPMLLKTGYETIVDRHAPVGGSHDKPPSSAPGSVAGAIADMQHAYFEIDQNSNDALFVACVQENDPTRAALRSGEQGGPLPRNSFLEPLCGELSRSYMRALDAPALARPAR